MSYFVRSRFFRKSIIFTKFYNFWLNYSSPVNFNYWWNFGSMALICLILQIVTGIFLAMHYKSDFLLAFVSIEYISREIKYGWLIHYMHSNGASIFFIVVYLHMLKALMYGSFSHPRQLLWSTGVLIFLIMIITAFLGYVLPWGQMSFWAATVITSLISAIPLIGNDILLWLWGGFSMNDATLNRFFSLHFFLPFLLFALSMIHLILLHEFGSNSPTGIAFRLDTAAMSPLYIVKDFFGMNILFIFFCYLIFSVPNALGHPDNYIVSNPVVTPTHIVPEWYFLPLYAILRSVTNKLLGVLIVALAFLFLFCLPLIFGLFNLIRSFYFKPFTKFLIGIFVVNCLFLGWLGGMPVIEPFFSMGQFVTFMFFAIFLFVGLFGFFEQLIFTSYSSFRY